jgi:ketosteroid isomerase-like protein
LLLALALPASGLAAEPRLTEASVRAFVAGQDAAWNARDARTFAAAFTPDAVFVAQARNSNGGITANGSSTLPQATAQARRFFARAKFHETPTVDRIEIAADGRSARVFGHEVTRIETKDRPGRAFCAETQQTVVLAKGRILSRGQIDTDVRCPR